MSKRSFKLSNENVLYIKTEKMRECFIKKCKKQSEKYMIQEAKYTTEKDNNRQLLWLNKITQKQFHTKFLSIQKKLDKTNEKRKCIECQLKNCYKQTHNTLIHMINSLLKDVDKKKEPKRYKLIMKYKDLFSKNMTVKDIIKFDQDAYGF